MKALISFIILCSSISAFEPTINRDEPMHFEYEGHSYTIFHAEECECFNEDDSGCHLTYLCHDWYCKCKEIQFTGLHE